MKNNELEIDKIKKIILSKFNTEFKLERNNPDSKAKRSIVVKTNYLKERLWHLQSQILFNIDNPNYVRKAQL